MLSGIRFFACASCGNTHFVLGRHSNPARGYRRAACRRVRIDRSNNWLAGIGSSNVPAGWATIPPIAIERHTVCFFGRSQLPRVSRRHVRSGRTAAEIHRARLSELGTAWRESWWQPGAVARPNRIGSGRQRRRGIAGLAKSAAPAQVAFTRISIPGSVGWCLLRLAEPR